MIDGEARGIPLSNGREAIVDAADFDWLSQWTWSVSGNGYVRRYECIPGKSPKTILMHRQITGAPDGSVVDHANHDTLDNRRANLRVCQQWQNTGNRVVGARNQSGYVGVFPLPNGKGWQARIRIRGTLLNLGSFRTTIEAAMAYDAAAREHRGEFARQNFPVSVPEEEPACQAQ